MVVYSIYMCFESSKSITGLINFITNSLCHKFNGHFMIKSCVKLFENLLEFKVSYNEKILQKDYKNIIANFISKVFLDIDHTIYLVNPYNIQAESFFLSREINSRHFSDRLKKKWYSRPQQKQYELQQLSLQDLQDQQDLEQIKGGEFLKELTGRYDDRITIREDIMKKYFS
jgi:hypothetical protein